MAASFKNELKSEAAAGTKTVAARAPRSFWRRLVERPQQMFVRRAIFQIHLWAGVIVGLYILVIGLTGSLLVFKEELMPRPRFTGAVPETPACSIEKLLGVVEKVAAAYPGKVAFLTACPTEANPLFMTTLLDQPKPGSRGGNRGRAPGSQLAVYSHPQTGEVLGSADREHSWVNWVEDLHVSLLLGRSGRLWNGIGAAVLLALTVTGLLLWWPGIRTWMRGLSVNFKLSWKRINWDLHNVAGFYTLFFTLMWAATGMYFTWPKLFTGPISKISPIVSANFPGGEMRKRAQHLTSKPVPLDLPAVLRQAQVLSPQGQLEGYFYGNGPKPTFTVYMARGRMGDYANTDFLYFDQNSGTHLMTWHRGQNQTLGDWLVWLVAPLHFGTSWGPIVKWAWFVFGLVLPLLTITGFLMYWNRWLGKRVRKLRLGA